jgi:hypothetical protein
MDAAESKVPVFIVPVRSPELVIVVVLSIVTSTEPMSPPVLVEPFTAPEADESQIEIIGLDASRVPVLIFTLTDPELTTSVVLSIDNSTEPMSPPDFVAPLTSPVADEAEIET